MSGLEIVGLLLGAIPLIIAVVENHRNLKTSLEIPFRYQQKTRDFIFNLRKEYLLLGKYLARLLERVGVDVNDDDPQDCRQALLDHVTHKLIADHLGFLVPCLHDTLQKFEESLEEIIAKLSVFKKNSKGPIKLHDILAPDFSQRALDVRRHRVVFAIRYRALKTLLENLRRQNDEILRLTEFKNVGIQARSTGNPPVAARRVSQFFTRVRQAAGTASSAIASSHNGTCHHPSHKMLLQLESRLLNRGNLTLKDRKWLQSTPIEFNVWFTGNTEFSMSSDWQSWQKAKLHGQPDRPEPAAHALPKQNSQTIQSARNRTRDEALGAKINSHLQRQGFRTTSSTQMTALPRRIDSFPYSPLDEVEDVCTIMSKARRMRKSLVLEINDQKILFKQLEELQGTVPEITWSLETLLLKSKKDRSCLLGAEDKYRVALDLTTSLLQLSDTAWHFDVWHKDNIYFPLRSDQTIGPCFIMQRFPAASIPTRTQPDILKPENVFIELAILLQEIFTNKTMEQYAKDESMEFAGEGIARLVMVNRWYNAERHLHLPSFSNMLEACLRLTIKHRAWNDEELRHLVYEDIVEPILETLRSQYSSYD